MRLFLSLASLSLLLPSNFITIAAAAAGEADNEAITYPVDVSFPIQGYVSTNYPHLEHNMNPSIPTPKKYENMPLQVLGNRISPYIHHINGCRKAFKENKEKCDASENSRILMNQRQPQSMYNLTETGFLKIRAPENLVQLITQFWDANKDKLGTGKIEDWGVGNTFFNHWESPTELLSVDDTGLRGSGDRLKRHIWEASSATLEEWTKEELQPCSLYGIRVYKRDAVLLPHVDHLPLVATAMINVAQDVEEPWPFEMYDHNGMAHNVTLDPGDMLLVETHSVIHGHPFPLKGEYYAMIFIHFEPTGRSLGRDESGYFFVQDENEKKSSNSKKTRKSQKDLDSHYKQTHDSGIGGHSASHNGDLPPYIKRQSPEEEHWKHRHPDGWTVPEDFLPPEAHVAAKTGQLQALKEALMKDEDNNYNVLTERDEHGWQVLHQGVVSGNEDVVKLLVAHGAEINSRTHGGYGETPLRIAERRLGDSNPIVQYLRDMGALSIGPEL